MPIIYGLAAMAAFATTCDQAGADPQIDKQYAIVKQGEQQPPVAQAAGLGFSGVNFATANTKPCMNDDQKFESTITVAGTLNQDTYRAIATTGQGTRNDVVVQVQTPAKAGGGVTFTTAPAIAWGGFEADSLRRLKGMDRKVSLQFTNANASDVLKWLGKQNVNFVANTDTLPKTKVTVNLKNVPLSEALETIAESLGGAWQVRGSTLIFRTGIRSFMSAPAVAPGQRFFGDDARAYGKAFGFNGQNDAFRSFNLDKNYKFDGKALQNLKSLDGKAFNLQAFPEFKGKLYDLKSLPEFKGKTLNGKVYDDFKGKALTLDSKAFGQMKDLKFTTPGTLSFGTTGFKKVDGEKLLKSISNAQKDLMKKQGFLRVSDLTSEQKAMIFTDPKADLPKEFKFIIVINDEKVTIQK